MDFSSLLTELDVLHDCTLCPRECHTDRFTQKLGYCRTGSGFNISSICIHQGEEPVISGSEGICNVFFSHCNLQCIYCQNYQISNNRVEQPHNEMTLEDVVGQIIQILETGIDMVGFVSPSHVVPQMLIIIKALESLGYHPTWVYNSSGYDKPEIIKKLDGIIDVYLPDMKYMDSELAGRLSDAPDYPEVARVALKEMLRQKGTTMIVNDKGYAETGLLIRHLVLPGFIQNSLDVINFIVEELSPLLHVGLMSQYYPAGIAFTCHELSRSLKLKEYDTVVNAMVESGISRGFIQQLESFNHYRPDFNKNHPFKHD